MTLIQPCVFTTSIALAAIAYAGDSPAGAGNQWPAWRGPLATGEAPQARPPTEWGEDKNVRWKVAIPGRGHATPIIWGDRIYIQTAVETDQEAPDAKDDAPADGPPPGRPRREGNRPPRPPGAGDVPNESPPASGHALQNADSQPPDRPPPPDDGPPPPDGQRRRRGPGGRGGPSPAPKNLYDFQVLALDRKTGKTLWTTTVKQDRPHEAGHNDASQVSNSPVTDGKNLYAYFGSRGLHCLSLDGKVKWSVDLGRMTTRNGFGEGSSPALFGDTLIVNWDHEGDDFIAAFDKRSGKQKWKVDRDEQTTWSTPLVVENNGTPQVVVTATNFVRAYDLKSGDEVWRCKGMTGNVIPSPMAAGGLLYVLSGFRGAALLAINFADAHDDITDSAAVVWKYTKDTPYVPSGLLYNGRLYFLENTRPMLTCLDADSGKPHYTKQRLAGVNSVYASLIGAGGHVYIVGRNGTTLVLKDGPSLEVVATNKLDDSFDASPAAVGNELYLRGGSHLYCLAAP
jgi:outer membrane protein assembly factor BamB